MKNPTHSSILLGVALFGAALTNFVLPAEARPQRDRDDNRRGDWRNNRDKDRDNDRYDNRDQRGNRRGNYRNQPDRRGNYRNNGYGNGGYGNGGYGGNYGYGNGGYGYGGNYGNGGYGTGGNYGYGNQSFTGRVTNVKSADEFNIRIGSTTYNVYTDSRSPRRLSVGDTVRVYGQRVGKNDIRNASASLLNNRW